MYTHTHQPPLAHNSTYTQHQKSLFHQNHLKIGKIFERERAKEFSILLCFFLFFFLSLVVAVFIAKSRCSQQRSKDFNPFFPHSTMCFVGYMCTWKFYEMYSVNMRKKWPKWYIQTPTAPLHVYSCVFLRFALAIYIHRKKMVYFSGINVHIIKFYIKCSIRLSLFQRKQRQKRDVYEAAAAAISCNIECMLYGFAYLLFTTVFIRYGKNWCIGNNNSSSTTTKQQIRKLICARASKRGEYEYSDNKPVGDRLG